MAKAALTARFNIVDAEGGVLTRGQLEKVLAALPIDFYTVADEAEARTAVQHHKVGSMDAYHNAYVISLYPPKGKKLSNAVVTNPDFPLRPDNIMDYNPGLRCCFHPKLIAFGMSLVSKVPKLVSDYIEIDIYKYSKDNVDRAP